MKQNMTLIFLIFLLLSPSLWAKSRGGNLEYYSIITGKLELYRKASAFKRSGFRDKKAAWKSFTLFKKSAEKGYAPAMYELAQAYSQGYGTPKDKAKALIWFEKSTGHFHKDRGLANGMAGKILYLGSGNVEVNKAKGLEYFEVSAELGIEDSKYFLATHYHFYEGAKREPEKALYWYKRIIKAPRYYEGSAHAGIGMLYLFGHGVKKDVALAKKWLDKSFTKKSYDFDAAYYLGVIYEKGIGTKRNLSLSAVYYKLAIESDYFKGMFALDKVDIAKKNKNRRYVQAKVTALRKQAREVRQNAQPNAYLPDLTY